MALGGEWWVCWCERACLSVVPCGLHQVSLSRPLPAGMHLFGWVIHNKSGTFQAHRRMKAKCWGDEAETLFHSSKLVNSIENSFAHLQNRQKNSCSLLIPQGGIVGQKVPVV